MHSVPGKCETSGKPEIVLKYSISPCVTCGAELKPDTDALVWNEPKSLRSLESGENRFTNTDENNDCDKDKVCDCVDEVDDHYDHEDDDDIADGDDGKLEIGLIIHNNYEKYGNFDHDKDSVDSDEDGQRFSTDNVSV
ncbi:hypothetical protein PoB_003059600 [Plakobranchus ocellatus]|uniref:Uncharacterized protein n=1 Tax=Plakobranchus ocellatus TaxID=259542 RepID=A0AAV3ZYQ0_9GAST|nr:hypothetical protein PoB_003059600 [Plakobranchus ocellatus]